MIAATAQTRHKLYIIQSMAKRIGKLNKNRLNKKPRFGTATFRDLCRFGIMTENILYAWNFTFHSNILIYMRLDVTHKKI